jgi:hypothetical protein
MQTMKIFSIAGLDVQPVQVSDHAFKVKESLQIINIVY